MAMGALQRFTAAGAVMDFVDGQWAKIEAPGFAGDRTHCKEVLLKVVEDTRGPVETSIRPYLNRRW